MRFHNEWALAAAYFITAAQVLVFVLVMPYGAATALKWSGAVLADGAVVVTTVALRSRSGNRMATLYMAALAAIAGVPTIILETPAPKAGTGLLVLTMLIAGLVVRMVWESMQPPVSSVPRVIENSAP